MSELTVDELYEVFRLAKKNTEDAITKNVFKDIKEDPDSYPRGIVLTEKNTAETIINIQKLSQTFPWINYNKRNKILSIQLENVKKKNWLSISELYVIEKTLTDNGVDCYLDISYHG